MSNSYGSIPQDSSASPVPGEGGSCRNRTVASAVGVVLAALYFLRGGNSGGTVVVDQLAVVSTQPSTAGEHWPGGLIKIGGVIKQPLPTNTADAAANGWSKANSPCDPYLGEEWLYGGEYSADTSASVYFTPEVGDVPGVLSAIEAHLYGHVEESLIGSYLTDKKKSKDGTYYGLPVALRNAEEEGLCDTEKPVSAGNNPYVKINPAMVGRNVPTTEDSEELLSDWKEGSCINGMGYHWETDIEGGKNLSYEASKLVPVVPMYNSVDGSINGVFLMATSRKQRWPAECEHSVDFPAILQCGTANFGNLNFWDMGPGLTQETVPPLYMCSNFCGECKLTGSHDGYYQTMHWFFKDTASEEKCSGGRDPAKEQPGPSKNSVYCRSGEYPS